MFVRLCDQCFGDQFDIHVDFEFLIETDGFGWKMLVPLVIFQRKNKITKSSPVCSHGNFRVLI